MTIVDGARGSRPDAFHGGRETVSDENARSAARTNNDLKQSVNFGRNPGRHDVPDTPQLERVQRWLLRYGIEHLQGPEEVEYGKDELVVLCLLYNGRHYLRSFVEHYFSLGAKHIVFLDNGSTDGTVEELEGYENVTVLRSTLFFKRYQLLMRQFLVERFGRERWTLLVDVDELFDYPYSDVVSLGELLGYLNEHSYTAVASYMLDMFPEAPLTEDEEGEDFPLKKLHRFYDTSNITFHDYRTVEGTGNAISNEEIMMPQGGVQRRLFGLHPLLLKHPLVFLTEGVRPADMSEHWACNARVADFTGVLFHYKLTGKLHTLVRREMEEGRYVNKAGKYEKYLNVLDENPCLSIRDANSRELDSIDELVGEGFLAVSPEYMEFVQEKAPDKVLEGFFRARLETEIQRQARRGKPRQGSQERQLQSQLAQERQRADFLQRKLDGILSSKSWRALDSINRFRKALMRRIRGHR